MRPNLLCTCTFVLTTLLCSLKSESQISDTINQGNKALQRFQHQLSSDSSIKSSFQKINLSLNLQSLIKDKKADLQQFSNLINPSEQLRQFTLPVNLNSPVIRFGKTKLSSQISNANSNGYMTASNIFHSNIVSADLSVWNVPFSSDYNSNSGWDNSFEGISFGGVKFDRESFLKQLKEKVKNVVNPEEMFSSALNQLYAKRDQAFGLLKNELNGVLKDANQTLFDEVKNKINIENLSYLGIDQFFNKIINENDKQILGKQNLFFEIQNRNKIQPSGQQKDSMAILSTELENLEKSKQRVQNQMTSLKEKWLKDGTLEAISGFEREKQNSINRLLSDPSQIAKIAQSKLKLNSLQKLLINAKSLNIGASGINQGNLSMKDVLLKGVSSEFLKGTRFLAPVMGTQPGIKNITDFAYSNFNELPNILTTAIRLGKGDMQKDFSHVSFALFQQNNNQQFLPTAFHASLPKNFVTTFSKRISLAESHTLQTELSKSTMLYNANGGSDGLKNVFNSQNLFGNMGIALDYNGTFEKAGIDQKLTVRYTGKEYSNLGNSFLVSGTKEISSDLKKYFWKRKLIVNAKVHFREYDFSIDERKWRSLSYVADLKWKMKKGEFIELRYQPYFNTRINKQESYRSTESYRLALRGNINRKVGSGFTYRNYIEAASSKDNFYDPFSNKFYSNSFVSFTSLQTLLLRKHTLFINLTGNYAKQNQGYLFGNSSLSLDAGISFSPTKNIALSSALVYNKVDEMYNQVAIRQSVSAAISKKINVEGFIHAGKNFYEQNYLNVPAVTGNLSICYNLK